MSNKTLLGDLAEVCARLYIDLCDSLTPDEIPDSVAHFYDKYSYKDVLGLTVDLLEQARAEIENSEPVVSFATLRAMQAASRRTGTVNVAMEADELRALMELAEGKAE